MKDQELYINVGYLANPIRKTNIEVEMPQGSQAQFIKNYALWTSNYPLPLNSNTAPYYVWPPKRDKWGVEMRAYFISNDNTPQALLNILEPSKIQKRPGYDIWSRRISTSENIIPLLKIGFVLGISQDKNRIEELIPAKFMEDFNYGYNL
jgi:hypothetical protein